MIKNNYFDPKQWCYPLYIRNLRLSELIKQHVKGVVLDYGCAGGKRIGELKKFKPDNIIAFDLMLDPEAVTSAKEHRVSLIQADGNKLPFDSCSFDFVLANHVIEHINNIRNVFNEISRVLKPGGILVLGIPTLSAFTFYFYYPFSWILYYIASKVSKKMGAGGDSIVHGKRLSLVGENDVLKITGLFEKILMLMPGDYLKAVAFSWGFTFWGAIFNHKDHQQKHLVDWWERKLVSSNLRLIESIPVGLYPLVLSNFIPRKAYPILTKIENTINKINCNWFRNISRDHYIILAK